MDNLVPVRVGDCACPDQPHTDGDIVYLLPMLGLEGGAAAELDVSAIQHLPEARRANALYARWAATYVEYGAVGWNLTDAKGKPVPFDVSVLVNDYSKGRLVAEKASDLYSEAVMLPLLETAMERLREEAEPSPDGSTEPSTSPIPLATRKPSRSSSRGTSAGQRSATGR